MRTVMLGFIAGLLILASTSFAYYYGGYGGFSGFYGSSFGGYSYSNYGHSGIYYPSSFYRSTGYYSNPFGSYYGSGSSYGYQRSSASFFFRSW